MLLNIFKRGYFIFSIRFLSASTSKLAIRTEDRFLDFVSREKYILPANFDRKDWYPKHMGVQMKVMEAKLRSVDLILEVHDARVAITGRNPTFGTRLYSIRPHILVLNKKDLVNMERYRKPVEDYYKEKGIENIFWTDCTERIGSQWDKLRTKMLELLQKEMRFNRTVKTEYLIMVVGIPNVGKSSLINSLRKNNMGFEKAVVEGPYPGVTVRVQNKVKIWDRPKIYILDTPGVLNPWVHNVDEAMKLAVCNLILESSTKPYFVADYLLFYMNKHRDFSYVDVLGMDAPSDDINKVLIHCCQNKNLTLKMRNHFENKMNVSNEIWDINSGIEYFLKLFRSEKFSDKFLDRDLLGFRDSFINSRKIKKEERKIKDMEKYLKQLENWVLDEGKIVTIEFMIRSTPLNAMQIQSLFDKLLKEQPKLNSTYYIIGQMGDGPNQRKKCLIVKNKDLEHVKNQFDKITLCNINSIHKIEMKDSEILFNADWGVENEITMDNLKGKAFITSAIAEKCYDKVKIISENIEPLRHDHNIPSPEKCQNQELSTKDEPPTKTKMEKQQTGGAKKAVKPGTQMKISNFFTRE